jgi:hypothetical protein
VLTLHTCTFDYDAEALTKKRFSFAIHTPDVTMYIAAPDQQRKDEWIKSLKVFFF